MNRLLLRLLALFCPGIDDPDVDPPADDPTADDADVDPPADDDTPDDDAPADDDQPADTDDEPAPRETRAQKTIRETRERAQRAEADRDRLQAQLEESRRQPSSQTTQPTPDQVLHQQEEEVLRNPETSDWQRYSINAARAAREANQAARAANARAEDMGDRAEFNALASTQPKLFAAYKDKVEERLKEIRARGNNAPRSGILKVLIGEDMLAGKLKTVDGQGPRKPAPARGAAPRSDVPRSPGRLSEAEARARRLENVRI